MRQLATIQLIKELHPIPDADAIEVATILGWHVVVKKGEHQVGDKVIYCEIDSVLPEREEFEFLRKNHFRIRTLKLRGQISQGICFPLDILERGKHGVDWPVGMDVTEILGITKYEPPIPACLAGQMKGAFPAFLIKTDETRVQILQDKLTEYKGTRCVYTEKLDGTSATFYLRDGDFGACSREVDLLETEGNTYWQMAHKYGIKNILASLPGNFAIQGEIIGEGIQKNKYALARNERRFYVFNVFNIDKYEFMSHEAVRFFCNTVGLLPVPALNEFELIDDIDALVELAKGRSVLNEKAHREGIVIRPLEETQDRQMGRLSFKAINPDFLLKYDD